MYEKRFILIGLICFLSLTACRSGFYADNCLNKMPHIEGAFYVGTDLCIPCHDDIYVHFKKTVHSRLSSIEALHAGYDKCIACHDADNKKTVHSKLSSVNAAKGCESCHGPGSIHVNEKGGSENIVSFSRLSPEVSSMICLSCHRGGALMDWRNSSHIVNDIACIDCHKPHSNTSDKMVYLGDPDICFTCHQDKKAQHMLPSHHPLREKKMKCGDCHNNHGTENNSLKQPTLNELCFECHAEYQGPFVYEHDPVFEDCSICHDPHGTIANNLLKQSDPFICLRCHKGHRGTPKTGPHPTVESFLTSCTQCHSQVHGTDLPSQMSGYGLTR